MEANGSNPSSNTVKLLDSEKLVEEEEEEEVGVNGEKEDAHESDSLLSPRRGGMSKRPKRTRRKVQWNDRNGNKLVEILEFEPSDTSDTDDEDSESCICTIM